MIYQETLKLLKKAADVENYHQNTGFSEGTAGGQPQYSGSGYLKNLKRIPKPILMPPNIGLHMLRQQKLKQYKHPFPRPMLLSSGLLDHRAIPLP